MHKFFILLVLPFFCISCHKNSPANPSPSDTTTNPISTDNQLVFDISMSGNLYAFDATTGKVRWKNTYNTAISNVTYGIAPTMTDSTLYVAAQDLNVYGLNAFSGQEKWHFLSHSTTGLFVCPMVANNILYTGDFQTLYAINAKTGQSIWQIPFEFTETAAPTVENGTLYTVNGRNGGIFSYDAATGAFKNSFDTTTYNIYDYSSPVVSNGVFYAMRRNDPYPGPMNYLSVLDANTGLTPPARQGYAFPNSPGTGVYFACPTVADSVAYTAVDSTVFAVNTYYTGRETPPNYNLVWQFKTGGILNTSPTLDSSALYIISSDGNLYALDRKTGAKLWTYSFFAPLPLANYLPSPVVANGVVYFGSNNGFYAVWAKNGKLLWQAAPTEIFQASPCILSKSGHIFQSSISGAQN